MVSGRWQRRRRCRIRCQRRVLPSGPGRQRAPRRRRREPESATCECAARSLTVLLEDLGTVCNRCMACQAINRGLFEKPHPACDIGVSRRWIRSSESHSARCSEHPVSGPTTSAPAESWLHFRVADPALCLSSARQYGGRETYEPQNLEIATPDRTHSGASNGPRRLWRRGGRRNYRRRSRRRRDTARRIDPDPRTPGALGRQRPPGRRPGAWCRTRRRRLW